MQPLHYFFTFMDPKDPFLNPSVCSFPPFEECFLEARHTLVENDDQPHPLPSPLEDVEVLALLHPVHFPSMEGNALDTSGISVDAALVSYPSPDTLLLRPLISDAEEILPGSSHPFTGAEEQQKVLEASIDSWWQGKGPFALNTPPGKGGGGSLGTRGETRPKNRSNTSNGGEIEPGGEQVKGGDTPSHPGESLNINSSSCSNEREDEEGEAGGEEETLAERLGALWLAPNPPSPTSHTSRRETRVEFLTPGTPRIDVGQMESPVVHVRSPASHSLNEDKGLSVGAGSLGRRRLSFTSSPVKSPVHHQAPLASTSPLPPKENRIKSNQGGIARAVNLSVNPSVNPGGSP
jgi:hypothetical protein